MVLHYALFKINKSRGKQVYNLKKRYFDISVSAKSEYHLGYW